MGVFRSGIIRSANTKYYMNNTWIAVPIDGKEPTDEELFGDLKLR